MVPRYLGVGFAALSLLTVTLRASAEMPLEAPPPPLASDARSASPPTWLGARGTYLHWYGTSSLGRGLRFNNPYRLSHQLGGSAESLSLSATYLDLGVGVVFGPPDGWQHGGAANLAVALDGIAQEVLTLSYAGYLRLTAHWALRTRAGIPIVLEPDAGLGLEGAAGGVYFVSAAIGVTLDLVGSVYYGAATRDQSVTLIPVAALQLGVALDYEVLP